MDPSKFQQFERLFNPGSIAVVGASRTRLNYGTRLLQSLDSAGFSGGVYAVNPGASEIAGVSCYRDLASVPGQVDYVVTVIPARQIPDLLDQCAAKGVKAVHMFTAGYRETGLVEGEAMERELVARARRLGLRIIGPNCIGVFNPAIRLPYPPMTSPGKVGHVAFISQSGGHASRIVHDGTGRGLGFSKAISFGNGTDLDSPDYLEYFAADPRTRFIGAYLEGVRDGQRLLRVACDASRGKPFVLWKGGRTQAGAVAAASHTGSLASSDAMWTAAAKQMGNIKVHSAEEMVDTLLALQCLWPFRGRRLAVVSGLVDGGGGDSVAAGDGLASVGLEVAPFSRRTLQGMRDVLAPVGTISRNPLDVGGIGGEGDALERLAELAAADPAVELVLVQLHVDLLLAFLSAGRMAEIAGYLVHLKQRHGKPVAVVSFPGERNAERHEFEMHLVSSGIPTFPSLDRAARALANLSGCQTRNPKS